MKNSWIVVDSNLSSYCFRNKKYVLWNVYLPDALHSVCLNKLSICHILS